MSLSFWLKFFQQAGVPYGDAQEYALLFEDNRMTEDMLGDLKKEYLNDMGIKKMGDVIRILKCASEHSSQEKKSKLLLGSSQPAPSANRDQIDSIISSSSNGDGVANKSSSQQAPTQSAKATTAAPKLRTVLHNEVASSVRSLRPPSPVTDAGSAAPAAGPLRLTLSDRTIARQKQFERETGIFDRLSDPSEQQSKSSVFSRLSDGKSLTNYAAAASTHATTTISSAAHEPIQRKRHAIREIRFDAKELDMLPDKKLTVVDKSKRPKIQPIRFDSDDEHESRQRSLSSGSSRSTNQRQQKAALNTSAPVRKAEAHSTVGELGATLYSDAYLNDGLTIHRRISDGSSGRLAITTLNRQRVTSTTNDAANNNNNNNSSRISRTVVRRKDDYR